MDNLKFSFSKFFLGLLFVFSVFSFDLNAQVIKDYNDVINRYTLASPDVYSFEKYSLNPVNQYVGKQSVSVPIYTIKTGGIEYPISLGYDAGGIKVDQLASDVGLGWSLSNAMITRTINQANDFDNTGSLTLQLDWNTYSREDQLNNQAAFQQNGYSGKIGYFLQKETNHKIDDNHKSVDFLPDTYNFYANGFSTSFFFKDVNTPVEINPKGTKIQAIKSKVRIDSRRGYYDPFNPQIWQPNYNLLTQDFFTIIISTNDGIIYTFADCDYALSQNLDGYIPIDSPAEISAWHITNILDTNTGKKIDFVYENTSSNPNHHLSSGPGGGFYVQGAQRAYGYVETPQVSSQSGCSYYVPYEGIETYKLDRTARIDIQKKKLKRINFDEGQIVFNYNNEGVDSQWGTGRMDVFNGDYVSQIYIKDKNSRTIKSFNFTYGLFNSAQNTSNFNPDSTFSTYRYTRLKLTAVEEIGKPAHKFSYNESINLPPVNSFSVDFLGYFNNSADVSSTNLIQLTRPNPTLYYYPNQFEKSLLPFPVTGMNYTTIPGIFNRQANDFSKAWSLTKVEYPTGGSSEYTYESNEFEEFGQTIKGGGIRIVKQVLKDGLGGIRTIDYSYLKNNGNTSGKLSSIPYFGHPTVRFFDVYMDYQQTPPVIISATGTSTNIEDWKLFDKSNLNEDITMGAYVGYSRVIEKETGNGQKEFVFTSSDIPEFKNKIYRMPPTLFPNLYSLNSGYGNCISEFIIANSAIGSNIFTDNSYKRGKLLEEKIYDESNQLLKSTVTEYGDYQLAPYVFYQGITQPLHTQGDDNTSSLITVRKDYKITQFLPISTTISTFDNLGNQNDFISSYTYNSNGVLKTAEVTNSNGDVNKTKYYYPTDVTSTTSLSGGTLAPTQYDAYVAMTANGKNNISEPIQIEEFNNTVLNSTSRQTYKVFDPIAGYILPEFMKVSKGTNALIDKVIFHKYEGTNPIELSENGILKTVYIWGYNGTKIVAKIENVDYSTISSTSMTIIANIKALSDSDFSVSGENSLRTELNKLRVALPSAMVSTYTYDPLVGITSSTDPRGYTTFFEYDSLNRLKNTKDALGNVISTNDYNFHH